MRTREPCVYIMASGRNGTMYVGVMSDLRARVAQHRAGTFGDFTARYDVHCLAWLDTVPTLADAITHEKLPLAYERNPIERDNPIWDDLAAAPGRDPLHM